MKLSAAVLYLGGCDKLTDGGHHMEHVNLQCRQKCVFFSVKPGAIGTHQGHSSPRLTHEQTKGF